MVRSMRPGAVIVDCAIDQGGSVEGIHETSHAEPVYERHGVLHYAVGNIPGAVPHTSTYALTNATLPYVVELATRGRRRGDRRRSRARSRREHGGRPRHERRRRRGAREGRGVVRRRVGLISAHAATARSTSSGVSEPGGVPARAAWFANRCRVGVHRRGHAVEAPEQHDLAVEVVGLDGARAPGKALPRRRARAGPRRRRRPSGRGRRVGRASSSRDTASIPAAASARHALFPRRARCSSPPRGSGPQQRVDRVAQVVEQLAVLPAHDVGARLRRRTSTSANADGDRRRVVVDTVRIATDVEDAGDRRGVGLARLPARGAAPGTPRTRRRRARSSRSAARSLATPFCTHTTATIGGAERREVRAATRAVCWLFTPAARRRRSRKLDGRDGVDTTGIGSTHRVLGPVQAAAQRRGSRRGARRVRPARRRDRAGGADRRPRRRSRPRRRRRIS